MKKVGLHIMKHYLFVLVLIYLAGSIMEHVLHKLVMHSESNFIGRWHLIHHKNTNEDMSLNTSGEDYNEILPDENIAIDDPISLFAVFVFSIIVPYVIHKTYPVKLNLGILWAFGIFLGAYTILIWNSIHGYIHNRDAQKMGHFSLCNKSTEFLAKNSSFIRWLIRNHEKHHLIKGKNKGNFNITMPGADFIFGTYN